MKLGISSYTFPWGFGIRGYPAPEPPLTLEGLVTRASELGVDVVQIADNARLDELGARWRRDLFARAREAGVGIELGTRGTSRQSLLRYVEMAGECGATILRSVPTAAVAPGDEAGARSFVESTSREIASILPELERAGVTLCLENYEGLSVATLAELVRGLDTPHVRVCLDSLNSLGRSEGYETVVSSLAPLTGNLHIKDYTIRRVDHRLGFTVVGTAAGDGELPICDLVPSVSDRVSLVIELWTPWMGSIEATVGEEARWARSSVDYLRGVIVN
ncbi:MAG: sugar phosphate isomerase/epimerase family protein [Spirochaetota bacterium]